MKLYLAGPMTGIEFMNFPLFNAESARIRALGYEVVNPVEINDDPEAQWIECMKADIRALIDCDGVALLDGWERSRGATLEHHIASNLGLHIRMACHITEAA